MSFDWTDPARGDKRRTNGLDDAPLGIWDAGGDRAAIPPRRWLLGTTFCRGFISSLIADGGTGKTALRVVQLLALATGRPLTGEHVFTRCRVLLVSLEDDVDELRRRVRAAMLYHGVTADEIRGWLFLAAPGGAGGRLMEIDAKGRTVPGTLGPEIAAAIDAHQLDVVCLDPFVKTHAVEENANGAMNQVIECLAGLAMSINVAIDVPHHTAKGASDPGNANRGRGASAVKDGARLVYTLTTMSTEEAKLFGVPEAERRRFIRVDAGKVNIAPPAADATWFKLISVPIGNGDDEHPGGDNVQTVERWHPPDTWEDISPALANRILDEIDAGMRDGERYSAAPRATARAAWTVVQRHASGKTEQQCREIVNAWVKNGVLITENFHSPKERKDREGLRVVASKRPGKASE